MQQRNAEAAASDSMLAAAQSYARRGWPVMPLRGKTPRTAHGLKDASTHAPTLDWWWLKWPDADVGVRTGEGLVVIDVDGHEGADSLHTLERVNGELPQTPTVETARGQHVYFATFADIGCSAGQLGPGLDVRGRGGFVVAPPSRHASGRVYAWDWHPDLVPIAPLPEWLQEQLTRSNGTRRTRPVSKWRQLAANGVGEGARNDSVARLAGHLLARDVDAHVTLELVLAWNTARCRPPLDASEVTRTVDSIAGRELRKRAAR